MTNTLLEKITADVDAEVSAITAEAAAEVSAIQAETKRVVETLQSDAAAALTKKQQQLALVATAKAKQAGTIAVQAAKRAAIDELFATVTATMLAETGADYCARYTKRAKAMLPAGCEVVSVAAPAAREAETKEIMTTLGIQAPVTATNAVRAGLIITATDGVYDVSFDRLMAEVRPTLEIELAQAVS